jgi:hypothetical protein
VIGYWLIAAFLAFGAVVEMEHCRTYIKARNYVRVVFTGIAAIALLYIASEAAMGDWPSW